MTIDITQSGAAPVELETQVAKRVEDSVAGVTNVKHIKSTITDGSAKITIEFQLGTNTDRAVNDVKDAVSKVRQELPRTINEPIIQRLDIEGLPIVTYAASAPSMTLEELSWFIDDTVGRKLQGVRGVAQVSRVGGVKREIRVSLNPERLLALGITAGEVNLQLRATNTDLAGGRGEVGGAEQSIRALASATTVERLASTSITIPGGRKVRLDQLGQVTDSAQERRTFAKLNGRDVVAFTVVRAKGESDLSVAAACFRGSGEARGRKPARDIREDRLHGGFHHRQLPLRDGYAARRSDPRYSRGAAFSSRSARDYHCSDRATALDISNLLGDAGAGLFAQHGVAAGHHARDRHPRRRRDRGNREHRPAHADGEIPLSAPRSKPPTKSALR